MEDSLKYFQPEISDIRVGYECEKMVKFKHESEKEPEVTWEKIIWPAIGIYPDTLKANIRVPYLTKEQLEKEGWEFKSHFWKGIYQAYYTDTQLHIVDHTGDTYFLGQCKDINTFRYIIKLLGIQ